jgi:hypothetical protein
MNSSPKAKEYINGTSLTGHGSWECTMKKPDRVIARMGIVAKRVQRPKMRKTGQMTFAKTAKYAENSAPIPNGSGMWFKVS